MSAIRSSLSLHRLRKKCSLADSPTNDDSRDSSQDDLSSRSHSPNNAFVIPGRTRYPSNQIPERPRQLDLHVARALLDRQKGSELTRSLADSHQQSSSELGGFSNRRPERGRLTRPEHEKPKGSRSRFGVFDGPFDSQSTSRTASDQSASALSGFSYPLSNVGSCVSARTKRDYETIYNRLAARHSLRQLQASCASSADERIQKRKAADSTKPTHAGPKSWFLSKLTRHASSKNLQSTKSRLSRKNSLGSLLGHRPRVSLQLQSLDDICRLGGVGVLDLPRKYSAVSLEIPTCLAATANFLALHCRDTPGIFRIPGQTSVTNAMYNHYMFRISDAENVDCVEATVGSLSLPPGLCPSDHDVASAFKKFLWNLPAGILGSTALFENLREICDLPVSKDLSVSEDGHEHADMVKLIALAIVSLSSARRLALICSVFGLLAFLKRDKDSALDASPSRCLGPEAMSSKALGVVFAPLLLGNLTDAVEGDGRPRGASSHNQFVTPRRSLMASKKTTSKHTTSARQSTEMVAGVELIKACSVVIERLLRSWEDISAQILALSTPVLCHERSTFTQIRAHSERTTMKGACLDAYSTKTSVSLQSPTEESMSTPRPGCKDPTLKPLPYPPTPSLHFDAALQRSASASAVPSFQRDGDCHVQFQARNELKRLARSNTALHLSDPAGLSPTNSNLERRAKMIPGTAPRAWWEGRTLSCAEAKPSRLCPVPGPYQSTSRGPKVSSETSCASGTMRTRSALSESTSAAESFSRSRVEATGSIEDENFPGQEHALSNKGSEFDMDKPQSSSASYRSATRPRCSTDSVEGAATTDEYYSTSRPASLDTLMPKRGGSSPLGNFRYSPSMIPRPVKETPGNRTGYLCARANTPTQLGRFSRSRMHLQAADSSPSARKQGHVAQLARIHGPPASEPPVARRLNFRPSPKENVRRTPSYSTTVSKQHEAMSNLQNKPNVGTLYAEIRRLHNQVKAKHEEIVKLKQHMEALKRFRDSGTLSEKLREAERETRMWRYRAQWAEMELFGRSWDREGPDGVQRRRLLKQATRDVEDSNGQDNECTN